MDNDSKIRAGIAKELGYQILSNVLKERKAFAEWLREDGNEEGAKEVEEAARRAANEFEKPSEQEREAWNKQCDARGVEGARKGEHCPPPAVQGRRDEPKETDPSESWMSLDAPPPVHGRCDSWWGGGLAE
ncbi:hypothetical protein J7T55_002190 [Diaporthe amygdali]|uniref:uncharacterized protein n=1 Tax=Phomopsis amygdali TaxID=1214568 RepID=UPI0022FEE04C|nr:uncharacterized protein J7T55_002190 [Diaporthe amygdali]KAJ0103771.1 hypothetical protein J7T55_002190 [Diaporthe amygdali]